MLFPINIDVPLDAAAIRGESSVADMLAALNKAVPYTIRIENAGGKSKKPHPELVSTRVTVPSGTNTARGVLRSVRDVLGLAWQVTVQPGYVMVYKETEVYPHARTL